MLLLPAGWLRPAPVSTEPKLLLLLLVMMSIWEKKGSRQRLPQWLSYLMRVVWPSVTSPLRLDEVARCVCSADWGFASAPKKGTSSKQPAAAKLPLAVFFFGQKHLFFITKTFLKFVCQQAVYQQKRFGDESISKGPFFPFKVLMDLFDCLCRLHPILHFSYFIKKKKKAFCLFSPFSVVRIRSRRRQTPRLLLPHLHKDCGRRCATQSARGWQVIQTRSTSLSVTNLSVYWIYKKKHFKQLDIHFCPSSSSYRHRCDWVTQSNQRSD